MSIAYSSHTCKQSCRDCYCEKVLPGYSCTPQLFPRVNGCILVLAYDYVYQVRGLIILLAALPSLQGLYNRLKQRKQARDCTVPNRLPLSEIIFHLPCFY